ncbi:MAG: hypothetical protein DRP87_12960 [Spirochaetes bacterium]|nr:MAG: hypothetical protein DRP87_12960 [Spirochaetota bacterium]
MKLNLTQKLIGSFIVLIALLVVCVVVSITRLNSLNSQLHRIADETAPKLQESAVMNKELVTDSCKNHRRNGTIVPAGAEKDQGDEYSDQDFEEF